MRKSTALSGYFKDQDRLIVETTAQITISTKKIKGWLVLTDEQVIFKSEHGNIEKQYFLAKIQSVLVYKFWGIITRGFSFMYEGSIYNLKVDFPADWVKLIQAKIKQQNIKEKLPLMQKMAE